MDQRYPHPAPVPLLLDDEPRVTTLEEEDLVARLEGFNIEPYPRPSTAEMSELNAYGDSLAREVLTPGFKCFSASNSIKRSSTDRAAKDQQRVLDRNKFNKNK